MTMITPQTPVQKAIEELQIAANFITDNDSVEDRRIRYGYRESIRTLKSLLPYEKQFMQGVFERGSEREVKPGQAFLPEPAPDFETLYSQFNQ